MRQKYMREVHPDNNLQMQNKKVMFKCYDQKSKQILQKKRIKNHGSINNVKRS